jgi:hypothetical protein
MCRRDIKKWCRFVGVRRGRETERQHSIKGEIGNLERPEGSRAKEEEEVEKKKMKRSKWKIRMSPKCGRKWQNQRSGQKSVRGGRRREGRKEEGRKETPQHLAKLLGEETPLN